MDAQKFNKELIEYTGEREPAFYWKEVPKTEVWHNIETNELCSSIGVNIKCDSYDDVHECICDLYEAIGEYYFLTKGIYINETAPDL